MLRVDLQLPIEGAQGAHVAKRGETSLGDVLRDPAVIGVFVVALLTLVFALWLDFNAEKRRRELTTTVNAAVRDSVRLQDDMRKARELRAKREVVDSKVDKVRQIDQNRFAFVHVMDQAAQAIVAGIWLQGIQATARDPITGTLTLTIAGYAPSTDAVSSYMQQLEASPFIANVGFVATTKVAMNQQDVIRFELTAESELPDMAFLEQETILPDGTVASGRRQPVGSSPAGAPAVNTVPAGTPSAPAAGMLPTGHPYTLPDTHAPAPSLPVASPQPPTTAPASATLGPRPRP